MSKPGGGASQTCRFAQEVVGKKKCHTLRAQVVLDWQSKRILCIHYGKGKMRDLELFKSSKVQLQQYAFWLADLGY